MNTTVKEAYQKLVLTKVRYARAFEAHLSETDEKKKNKAYEAKMKALREYSNASVSYNKAKKELEKANEESWLVEMVADQNNIAHNEAKELLGL